LKFILDENVPSNIKAMLKSYGHEALDMMDLNMLSAKNGEVGKKVVELNAILVTLDEDFLHLKKEIKSTIRVIYIHVHPPNPVVVESVLGSNLNSCIARLKRPGVVSLEVEEKT